MNKKVAGSLAVMLLFGVLNAETKNNQKPADDHMQIPLAVKKSGEKPILFPDNFSQPLHQTEYRYQSQDRTFYPE